MSSASASSSADASATRGQTARLFHRLLARIALSRLIGIALVVFSAIFFALHFLHLKADFPNHSPWVDWSKYTDEGWYGDAAIRHYLSGHWYWKGDFNPAVALPVWPAIELLVFKFTGVSVVAARALTLCVFGVTLITLYLLIERHAHLSADDSGPSLAAPITIFLLCTSPLLYVFERMAILEPLLIALTALALLAASFMQPRILETSRGQETPRGQAARNIWCSIILMLLLPAMVLTKTTGVVLLPAIATMIWARAEYRLLPALRLVLPPFIGGAGLWGAYFFGFVRPHYLEDYRYLFSANAYTGIELEPFAKVVLNTITDGAWIGEVLYIAFFGALLLAVFWRPRLLKNPLIPSLLLWIGGYFAFLAYHNNLQPRYYLVIAVPITAVVALAVDDFRRTQSRRGTMILSLLAAVLVVAIAVPDAIQQIDYVLHPTYQFEAAAQGIKRIVLADKTHSHLILSISGSDLTLMTGLPSIDDDFGTSDLDVRVNQYRPGWYAAWNDVEDDKADALTPLYKVHRIAAFPAYDDPARNLLILYRLDRETQPPIALRRNSRHRIPKPLVTKVGQQPSNDQLQH